MARQWATENEANQCAMCSDKFSLIKAKVRILVKCQTDLLTSITAETVVEFTAQSAQARRLQFLSLDLLNLLEFAILAMISYLERNNMNHLVLSSAFAFGIHLSVSESYPLFFWKGIRHRPCYEILLDGLFQLKNIRRL
jgi:hypothetical protein